MFQFLFYIQFTISKKKTDRWYFIVVFLSAPSSFLSCNVCLSKPACKMHLWQLRKSDSTSSNQGRSLPAGLIFPLHKMP